MNYDFSTLGALLGLAAAIEIDPLIALPAGGIVCALACGHIKFIREYAGVSAGAVRRNIDGRAAASTTAGATIASQTFAGILTEAGVPALSAGAMVHAGATVIDSLPHGSFFHATGGAAGMTINERMKLIPFEACVGLTSTIVSVILYIVF